MHRKSDPEMPAGGADLWRNGSDQSRHPPHGLRRAIVFALAFAAATLALTGAAASAAQGRCGLQAEAIWDRAAPSVVEVFALGIDPYRVNDRVRPVFGSGTILPDGLVLTNAHVVEGAKVIIVFVGEDSWDAGIVGSDNELDLALLRLVDDQSAGPPLELAPLDSLRPGQTAFAIGFPLGLGKTISHGIVTGIGRVLHDSTLSWLEPMLQTDVAVNPGNSGGPLLDDCGRVIGLVSRTSNPALGEDIGFAVPVSVLAEVLPELARTGRISRPWHGLYGQMVTPPILYMIGAPPEAMYGLTGFLIETVEPGSAADIAGLRGGDLPVQLAGLSVIIGGDIITAVDGRPVDTLDNALDIVRGLKVGQEITVDLLRDGEPMTVTVTLPERPPRPMNWTGD